jgi:hypothetical protein
MGVVGTFFDPNSVPLGRGLPLYLGRLLLFYGAIAIFSGGLFVACSAVYLAFQTNGGPSQVKPAPRDQPESSVPQPTLPRDIRPRKFAPAVAEVLAPSDKTVASALQVGMKVYGADRAVIGSLYLSNNNRFKDALVIDFVSTVTSTLNDASETSGVWNQELFFVRSNERAEQGVVAAYIVVSRRPEKPSFWKNLLENYLPSRVASSDHSEKLQIPGIEHTADMGCFVRPVAIQDNQIFFRCASTDVGEPHQKAGKDTSSVSGTPRRTEKIPIRVR